MGHRGGDVLRHRVFETRSGDMGVGGDRVAVARPGAVRRTAGAIMGGDRGIGGRHDPGNSGLHTSRTSAGQEGSVTSRNRRSGRADDCDDRRGTRLEVAARGTYTVPCIRYHQTVSSAPIGALAGRLGDHARRCGCGAVRAGADGGREAFRVVVMSPPNQVKKMSY